MSTPKTPIRPPYDPELAAMLDASPLPQTITPDMIEGLRAVSFAAPIDEVLSTRAIDREDRTIAGPGGELTVSIFTPRNKAGAGTGIYFLHGGGMIIGDRFTGVDVPLEWVERFGAVLVTVEYRLAPEHPDPAPVEDGYAGLLWTVGHSADLGIDPERLMIAGTSAGAGIAAGVALLARDRGGPALLAQMLMSPMLDDRNETVSSHQYSKTGSWSRESNDTGWDALLGVRRKTEDVSIYSAPARATDLSGLPAAYIDVGSAEVFRDEAVAYAGGLWAAGVQAALHVWPGGFHQFEGAVPSAALSVQSREARTPWVGRTFGF